MQPLDCLRRYPLFALLTPSQLDAWLAAAQELTFAAGETIFQQGSAGVWAYLVLEGEVRIVRTGRGRRELSLGVAGPGELFGEYALLQPHRNTATCRPTEPTRLLRLPLLPLRPVLAAEPALQANLKGWLRLHALVCHLRGQAFLGFLSAPSALRFLDRLDPATFRAVRTVQADRLGADRWYYIESGEVFLHPPDGDPPRELGPGDCFGEAALLGRPELPVAVAMAETRCLVLRRHDFSSAGETSDPSWQSVHSRLPVQTHPWVGQREEADCGVAALVMVARCHGLDVCVEALRREVHVGRHGVSLAELQRLALAVGLRGQAVRVDPEQLEQVGLPAVVHLAGGHYVVLYELSREGVVVGDPATGVVRLSRQAFTQQSSGNLLLLRLTRPGSAPVEG